MSFEVFWYLREREEEKISKEDWEEMMKEVGGKLGIYGKLDVK